jgi:hypothetical protein
MWIYLSFVTNASPLEGERLLKDDDMTMPVPREAEAISAT